MRKHGVTENTPKNTVLGAGVIYKNFNYDAQSGDADSGSVLIGATKGGNSLTITPNIINIEPDGALVKVKGLAVKQGETAELEINMLELTDDVIKMSIIGSTAADSGIDGFTQIDTKADIEEGDYITKLAFVGETVDGRAIIVVFANALCTSGLSIEAKMGDPTVIKLKFEANQAINGDLEVLPVTIYYPPIATQGS
ncbi:MAG: hypothetical protein LBS74_02875 [Oscillospiraceae bacterium]|jgi:hypothetical protein|nr:hypothetical protein [Oscillospiraceae bacterium]